MPKIADVKSKSRSKRKPLRDVSNGGIKPSLSNTVMKKSNPDAQLQVPVTTSGAGECGDPLDQLLLVHSDLSALIHQIDELVVQALEQKVMNKKEIESFAHVLNEVQTSLKPWISRFQKALSTHATDSKNQLKTTLASKKIPPSINEHTSKPLENQDSYKLDFLVSPSPLVSWRADSTLEGGRNLFMLTPLPKPSAFSSKLKISSKSVFKNITNDLPIATDTKTTVESEFSSPEKLVKRNNSIIVSTPYLKMSPPKSCVLLEPASEYCNKNTNGIKKPIMHHPVGDEGSGDSEPCSSQPYGHLGLKYPELFGIRHGNKVGHARKVVEASPNWFMSPPKSCVLLEPSDDQAVIKDVDINLNKPHNKVVIESTPMCKDLDTTILRGKRVGENTLKKELWMRFEAATGHEFSVKASVGGQTTTSNGCSNNKGFMELLEEVCSDD